MVGKLESRIWRVHPKFYRSKFEFYHFAAMQMPMFHMH